MYIESNHKPEKILGILNSEIPNMRFHSWAEVPKGFNPRHSTRKTYTYLLKCEEGRKEPVKEILLKFVGISDHEPYLLPEKTLAGDLNGKEFSHVFKIHLFDCPCGIPGIYLAEILEIVCADKL